MADDAAQAEAEKSRSSMDFATIIGLVSGFGLVAIAIALLYKFGAEEVSIHFYIAVALGIGFTMLLTSALMGLVFLSSGTGHDEAIEDPLRKDD